MARKYEQTNVKDEGLRVCRILTVALSLKQTLQKIYET